MQIGASILGIRSSTQRAQYGLTKEYTLNHIVDPFTLSAEFINSAMLGSLAVRGTIHHSRIKTMGAHFQKALRLLFGAWVASGPFFERVGLNREATVEYLSDIFGAIGESSVGPKVLEAPVRIYNLRIRKGG